MGQIVVFGFSVSTIFCHFISQTARFSGGKFIEKKCVFWFSVQILSDTFLILRINGRDVIKNVYWSLCQVPVIFSDFNETWFFSRDFRKIVKYQISWKFVYWEPRRTDGQTDTWTGMPKFIIAFRNLRERLLAWIIFTDAVYTAQ